MEITSLQGIGIGDIDTPPGESKDETIERLLQREVTRMNAERNLDFYTNYYEDRAGKSTTNKALETGTLETLNALSSIYNRGAGLSAKLINLVGVDNSSKIIAGAIKNKAKTADEKEQVKKDLEEFATGRYDEVIESALENAKHSIERTENYDKLSEEGVIHKASAWSAKGREMAKMGREIGMTVGSLQATAGIIDSLREKGRAGDIVMDMGKDLARARRDIKRAGLTDDDYVLKEYTADGKKRWKLVISSEKFGSLIDPPSMEAERDQAVVDIKSGKRYDPDWLPEGQPKTHFDFKTPKQLGDNTEGWERYTNKPGVDGYTSEHPDGATLYRKEKKSTMFASPQKMIHFALEKKRAIMNLGAGTGKTAGFLGVIQSVKDRGELDTFALHTMPSRLREEFFKDAQKYFPNLKVVNLDTIKGMDKKVKALEDASQGKYDIVITGHDSMKLGGQDAKSKKLIKTATARALKGVKERYKEEGKDIITEVGKDGKEHNVSYWSSPKGEAHKKRIEAKVKEQLPNKHKWLPDVIASFNPSVVTVDEAHEGFKNIKHKGSSVRANAIKTIAKKPKYFIPATGTVVRNDIGELAGMAHITNPEAFPEPRKWTSKYENTNQGNTVFQEQAVEGFRQSLDDVMLTEHLKLYKDDKKTQALKMKENKHSPTLTDKQKKKLREVENIYHSEKKVQGHSIMNNDTFELHKTDGENIDSNPDLGGLKMTYEDKNGNVQNTQHANEYIKSRGLDPKEHRVVELGQRGASARRDSKYNRVLHAGKWHENGKALKALELFKKNKDKGEKTIIFYESKKSLPMLQQMMKDEFGYTDGKEMHFVDGSVKFGKGKGGRNDKVTQFNTNPDSKVMFSSSAGMTGLNMQTANNVIWLSRSTQNALQKQGNARVMRTGQKNDTNIDYLDSATIYDDRRVDLNKKKEKTGDAIGESPQRRITMQRILEERRKNKVNKEIICILNFSYDTR